MKISSLQKYPIHIRERTEPHVYKPNYKVSDNYNTEISNGEKKIEFYEDMDKWY